MSDVRDRDIRATALLVIKHARRRGAPNALSS